MAENDRRNCIHLKNKWGWWITISTFFLILPVTGILSSFGVFYVKLQEEFGISDFLAGWIGALAFGVMFAFSPISTWLFKRFGHRKIVIAGVLLCSTGLLLSAFVPDAKLLFLTYSVLYGIGSNFIDNTTLNLIAAYFPRKNSARATCFATLGWSIGSLTLNPALERLCTIVGWRHAFQILSAGFLVVGLFFGMFFRPAPERYEDIPDEEEIMGMPLHGDRKRSVYKKPQSEPKPEPPKPEVKRRRVSTTGAHHTPKEYLKTFLQMAKAPGIVLWFSANICMNLSLIFPFVNMIKFMTTIGIPEAQGTFVLSVMGFADLIGRGGSALFGDYLPFHCVYVYPIFNGIMGVATFILLLIGNITGMFVYAFIIGISTGIVNSMLFKACIDLFGVTILAEAWTFTLLAAGIGTTVGPTVAGATFDLTGSFDVAFIIGGTFFSLATLSTLLIPCVQKRKRWRPVRASKLSQTKDYIPAANQNVGSTMTQQPCWKPMTLTNEDDENTPALEESGKSVEIPEIPSTREEDSSAESANSASENYLVEQYVWSV